MLGIKLTSLSVVRVQMVCITPWGLVNLYSVSGENGYNCEHCGKAFNRRSRLKMHVKYIHEGAKPYECDKCTKTFVRKEDLSRHSILHTGVKGGFIIVLVVLEMQQEQTL